MSVSNVYYYALNYFGGGIEGDQMSTRSAHEEIRRFLRSSKPEVLCVTGKWGVGKTYSWKRYLVEAESRGEIALNRYAYVSLFGQNSLDDLRYAIFENTIPTNDIGGGPTIASLKSITGRAETLLRGQMWLARILPQRREFLDGAGRALFFVVRDQIICIDDLERAGADLAAKDVLGMISFLKEERRCKVVLLLNDEELPKEAKIDFAAQLEKVADTRVVFDPTPVEAAEIGLSQETTFHEHLAANCVSLGITNIRVIKKIERTCETLAERLDKFDTEVLKQAVHTTALLAWIHYQPALAPPLELVKKQNPWRHLASDKKQVSEDEKKWGAMLQAYGFSNVDELDRVILHGIEKGYFDTDALEKAAAAVQKQLEHQRRDNSFSKAWDLYHYSWASAEDVLDKMYSAFRENVSEISPANLNGTVALFKELGRPRQAKDLLDFYMTRRDDGRQFFDLSQYGFADAVTDPDVMHAFSENAQHIQGYS